MILGLLWELLDMEAVMFVDKWHHFLLLDYQNLTHVKHLKSTSNTDES